MVIGVQYEFRYIHLFAAESLFLIVLLQNILQLKYRCKVQNNKQTCDLIYYLHTWVVIWYFHFSIVNLVVLY